MVDLFSKNERSKIMSKIRSESGLDQKLFQILRKSKINHQMYPKLIGRPDAFLIDHGVVIFVDGCFWHKCPKCFKMPESNKEYWLPKIERNISRSKEVNRELKKKGYKVIRIWEHQIKNEKFDIMKILRKL